MPCVCICDMVTLIHDQTHTRRSLTHSLSQRRTFLLMLFTAVVRLCFFHLLLLSFIIRQTPNDPNDELTKFRLLFIRSISHVRFRILAAASAAIVVK